MADVTPSATGPDLTVPARDGTLLSARRLGDDLVGDPGFQLRFPAEVSALQGLNQPSLAAPTSYLRNPSGRVVVCLRRHVQGVRLSSVLEHHPRGLDAQTTTVIAWDVLTALAALHARGVGHLAVMPEHVIVDSNGISVLVDVGLAPRPGGQALESIIATDLTWFADLITLCLAGGPAGRRRRQAPLRMGAWLPRTLPEPLRSLLRSVLSPARSAASASAALAELRVAAVRRFDADWDVRARERLLAACRVATTTAGPLPRAPAARTRPRKASARHRDTRPAQRALIAVVLLGAGAAAGVYALTTGHPVTSRITARVTPNASVRSMASAPATVTGGSTPAGAPSTASNTSPNTAPHSAPHSAPPTSRSATAQVGTPGTTAVISLTVIEFSYINAYRVDDLVIAQVRTSGTGRVVLSLQARASGGQDSAEPQPPTKNSYSLQGATSYLVVSLVPSGRDRSAKDRAVTASTIPRAAATQYTQLFFPAY